VIFARFTQRLSRMAALLAVVLLCVASVKSTVMRAEAGALGGVPICSIMGAKTSGPADKAHKACEFCAAAAHAPVSCDTTILPTPTAVAWAPYRIRTATGPRGPPAFRPTARGPPFPNLTI
jgi:hypothetical protein